MAIYTVPPKQEVYDLINEANPTLTKPVSQTNVLLGTPVPIPDTIWPASNTQIMVTPAGGSYDFVGRKNLPYRRRDLNKLFRGISVQVAKFASKGMDAAQDVVFTVYELLPDVNRLYGLNLTQDDIESANIVRGNTQEGGMYTTSVVVQTKPGSLAYIGSFSLKWINARLNLADMITVTDLPTRLWPGGNLFDESHKEILTGQFYQFDVSSSNWWNYEAGYNGAAFARQQIPTISGSWGKIMGEKIAPLLNQLSGGTRWHWSAETTYLTDPGQLAGMDFAVYQLPAADYPAANERFYSWVLVIFAPDDCPWACGDIVLHYNKQ